jgi:hypothetical protein
VALDRNNFHFPSFVCWARTHHMRSIICTALLRYTYVNVIYMLDATIIREVARAGVDDEIEFSI